MHYFIKIGGLLLLTFLSNNLWSQTYKIDTSAVTFQTKTRPCLYTSVDPDAKDLKKALKKHLKKTYAIKVKGVGFLTNKDILKAEDVMLGSVSNNRLNLYAYVTQSPKTSNISMFGSFGYDIFIDTIQYKKEFGEIKNIMNRFLLEYLNNYYSKEISKTSKKIKKLQDKKTSLSKYIDKNNRRVSRAERKIGKLENKKAKDEKQEIKVTEKTNDLNNLKIKLENKNQKSAVKVQLIEDKIPSLNDHLKQLMFKHKELSKVAM